MTPMMRMPALRQIYRTPEGPWWRRVLGWWRAPVVYEVVEDFEFRIGNKPANLFLPAGFRTDLASTPRLSWLFGFRPDGRLLIPGLFHDFWYRHGYVLVHNIDDKWGMLCGGKFGGDQLLLQLTRHVSGLHLPGWVAFAALYLFGWPAWWANGKYRKDAIGPGGELRLQLKGDYTDDHGEPEQAVGE